MTEQEIQNKALVRRIYEELWNQGRLDVADELFARPEGVRAFVREFLAAIPDLRHSVEELITEDDRVAARFTARGTHTGAWREFLPRGNEIQYSGVTLVRIEGGKIGSHHTWWDTLEVIQQMTRQA
jgi:predicted ester cyclase